MKDRHSIDVRAAAHLAAGEELADDSRPTWAEAQVGQPEPLPARPRRWIRDSNGFAWEAVYPENER